MLLKKALSITILFFFVVVMGLALFDAGEERFDDEAALTEPVPEPVEPTAPKKKILTAAEKKKRFVEKTLPAIRRVKAKLDADYDYVLALSQKPSLSPIEQAYIDSMKLHYKVKGIPCLLNRLKTHPVSIVLAQAALETGWGTSRFYTEANNIFGIWSYNSAEPRMAAGENRGEKTIYVKRYPNLEASIEGYFKMMATGYAYDDFREARKHEQNPFKLIRHLSRYSELRDEYVKRVYHVIKTNRFYRFDATVYHPIALADIIPEYVAEQKALKEANQQGALLASELPPAAETPAHIEERNDENERVAECDDNATKQMPG